MEKEIEEGNFLISVFSGFNYESADNECFKTCLHDLHNYNNDWNILMPVVEKVNTICRDNGYELSNHSRDQEHLENPLDNPLHWKSWNYRYIKLTTDINLVWKQVVSFIKWYNQYTKQSNK